MLFKILNLFPSGVINKLYFWFIFVVYKFTGKALYPRKIIIDPSNICNLACPLCANGSGSMRAEKSFMKIELFEKILKEIPTIKHISLFNWGESFLNPQINKMIEIAKEKGIHVSIHTNLSFKKTDKFWEEMIKAGPDEIETSLDGTTQAVYQKYRKNGELKLILNNLRKIVEIKNKLGKNKPRIFWKFMVNKFNEEQIEAAREKAEELGIDFEITTMEIGDENPDIILSGSIKERIEKWLPNNKEYLRSQYLGKYEKPLFNRKCDQLFTTLAISPTGKVLPCCWAANDDNSFGDISREKFENIWNNEKYQYARNLFIGKVINKKADVICNKCSNFKQDKKLSKKLI